MPLRPQIDFVVRGADGSAIALVEARSRRDTSASWAAKLRRNLLQHDELPSASFFLIVTLDHVYGWNQNEEPALDAMPDFSASSEVVLGDYFRRLRQDPATVTPYGFELVVLAWLTDVAIDHPHETTGEADPFLASFTQALRRADIQMPALQ